MLSAPWSSGAAWSARRPVKPEVAGSNPVWTANDDHGRVAQLVEHAPEKRGVTGSTPVPTTRRIWSAPLRGRWSVFGCGVLLRTFGELYRTV